jgi:hypothetical protein
VKGTSEAEGSNVKVVEEVSAQAPGAEGEIVGMGLPVESGSVRFTWIGPAGDTPLEPDFGEVEEIASAIVWAFVVEVLLDPGPFAALEEGWWSTTIATTPAVTTTTTATIATNNGVFGSLRARYVLTVPCSPRCAKGCRQYGLGAASFLVSGRTGPTKWGLREMRARVGDAPSPTIVGARRRQGFIGLSPATGDRL